MANLQKISYSDVVTIKSSNELRKHVSILMRT
jgi:hypothetical protein